MNPSPAWKRAKVITIWQPYASLIAMGIKTIETRYWGTHYRGPIVVHAAKRCDIDIAIECRRAAEWIAENNIQLPESLERFSVPEPLMGHALGWCELADCLRVPPQGWTPGKEASEADFGFGDLSPGRFAWKLGPFHPFPQPIAAKGQQGLWDWPYELPGWEASNP